MKKILILAFMLLAQISVQARYYDSKTNNFISRDPLGYVDGMSMNQGYFTRGMGADPSGTKFRDHGNTWLSRRQVFNKYRETFGRRNSSALAFTNTDDVPRPKNPHYMTYSWSESECGCVCIKLVKYMEFDLDARSWVSNDLVGITATTQGVSAIAAHEDRRRMVMEAGYNAYFKEFEKPIKIELCSSLGHADVFRKIKEYFDKRVEYATKAYLHYNEEEQVKIGEETWQRNLIFQGKLIHGIQARAGLRDPLTYPWADVPKPVSNCGPDSPDRQ